MDTHHLTTQAKPYKLSKAQRATVQKAIDLLRRVQGEVSTGAGDGVITDKATCRLFERLSDAAQYAASALKD